MDRTRRAKVSVQACGPSVHVRHRALSTPSRGLLIRIPRGVSTQAVFEARGLAFQKLYSPELSELWGQPFGCPIRGPLTRPLQLTQSGSLVVPLVNKHETFAIVASARRRGTMTERCRKRHCRDVRQVPISIEMPRDPRAGYLSNPMTDNRCICPHLRAPMETIL